ncbi:MAG: hypothetical protein KJ630_03695 [Proteobacteria bacterium]|nr:hypothetical protein [Pseudomonadota bacterium]
MKRLIDVAFEHDYDSNLFMLSKDPSAKNWKVIVHCRDGQKYVRSIEKFFAYPGCATHDGEAAWLVECFNPEKVEIQRPGLEAVIIRHPGQTGETL